MTFELQETYTATRLVRAVPMTRGVYNSYRGWRTPDSEEDGDHGYLVIPIDGVEEGKDRYVTWVPKDQFEIGYMRLKDLADTCQPHELRLAAELTQLDDRLTKLLAFIDGPRFDSLPLAEQNLMQAQADAMGWYSEILHSRAAPFTIPE